jgi:hypothetical protein
MEAKRQPTPVETFFRTLPNLSNFDEEFRWREYSRLKKQLSDLCSAEDYDTLHRMMMEKLGL